jgi:PTS system lactose-specific IIA component
MQQKGIAMDSAELELTMIEIVALSGDARTKLLNAVKKAKDGERDAARALVDEAQGLLNDAHTAQTDLLTAEARGEVTSPTVLLVHAQDHLMTTMLLRDVIDALMDIYR